MNRLFGLSRPGENDVVHLKFKQVGLFGLIVAAIAASSLFTLYVLDPKYGPNPMWAGSRPEPLACGKWELYPGATSGLPREGVTIEGLAVFDKADASFVGNDYSSREGRTLSLFHWDGRSISLLSSLAVDLEDLTIGGTVALSANDIWSVGSGQRNGHLDGVTFHWDGTSWKQFDIPHLQGATDAGTSLSAESNKLATKIAAASGKSVPTFLVRLKQAVAISPRDVWAVGSFGRYAKESSTLVLHWTGGVQWEVVPSPNIPNRFNDLNGVSALAANDIWAIGSSQEPNVSLDEGLHPLVMHWNGEQWETVDAPYGMKELSAISRSPGGALWIVGKGEAGAMSAVRGFTASESKWRTAVIPKVGEKVLVNSIAALSDRDVWAVGVTWYDKSAYDGAAHALALHFNGISWIREDFPTPEYTQSLLGVGGSPIGDLWAVGSYYGKDDAPGRPMLAHFTQCSESK